MKNLSIVLIIFFSATCTFAQSINWRSSSDDEHQNRLAYLNFGYDFGLTTQVGYGQELMTSKPTLLHADLSMPMGNKIGDDFKLRLGGQMVFFERSDFVISTRAYGIFRRHETNLVRMANFGVELSGQVGFYKPKWHIAGEFGFDKAITTHLRHFDQIRDHFPSIADGWVTPSGGNFFYGIQASRKTGKKLEISLRIGKTAAQFSHENALLPLYGQLGLVRKI